MSDEKKFHRGRSKEGKRQVTLYLTQEEYSLLKRIAEEELRSAGAHALWLVRGQLNRAWAERRKQQKPLRRPT